MSIHSIVRHTRYILFVLLTTLATLHAGQSAGMTAQEIVAKWRNAIHKTTELSAAKISSTSNEDGIPGTIDEWMTTSGSYRTIVKREFDTSEIVCTNDFAKRRDWNGFVRTIERKELNRLRTEIFEDKAIVFGPPELMPEATVADSGDQFPYELHIVVPNGTPMTWYIDKKTWLPVKSARTGDDSKITTTYEDWRESDGMIRPHHFVVTETDKPDYTIELTSIEMLENLPPESFAAPTPGPSDTHIDAEVPPIPFNFENSHIIFNIRLNNSEPILFLFDTGADQEVINTPHLSEFGLQTYGKTTTTGGGGSADYSYARGATFRLPGVEIRNQHVSILDESGLERAYGM
ncbi:MAG TPA: aspartyl protease family protein, partial [Bacteroidota bacterium]|nr:aspartyl protease family protein [Bacteroidota bacterium]